MGKLAPASRLHDIVVTTTKKYACAKVLGVPPEEFGIEKNARSIKDANYAFHDIVTKTESQLIAEGFDETQIKALATYIGQSNVETLARDSIFEHQSATTGVNSAARICLITEHYIRIDYEGNGKPRLYMVITGGNQGEILRKSVTKDDREEMEDCVYPIDVIPFAAITPVPITHRFFGRSIADLVMDIQRIKTALVRGMLDNLYLHNAPRPVVSESGAGPNTIDDLLTVRQGAPIRVKGDAAAAIQWQTVPDITPSVFPALQYWDATREARTGMSQQSQGLDANALQNQSATAVAQVFTASQMRMKLIARIIAEGVKDIFALLHGTIRQHGQQAETVRLRNAWINVDPRNWKTRNDMTIHVGLGTGDKAQQYAQMMGIANFQKELIMGGKGHMVPDAQLFNTASELVKLTGRKNPDRYFADPSEVNPQTGQLAHPPLPPAPDPKVQAIQAQAQNDQQELALKAQLDRLKAQDAAQLAQFKAEMDAKLQVIQAHLEAAGLMKKAHHDQQAHHAKIVETVVDVAAKAHEHDMKMERGQQQHEARLQQMKQKPAPAK